MHQANSFVTLTYRDDAMPAHGSVSKRDAQLFLKRLRKALMPRLIRYVLVAEYSPAPMWRAHYHAIIFGEDFRGDAVPMGKTKSGFPQWESQVLTNAWGKGRVTVSEFTQATAFYTVRYNLKSLGSDDGERGSQWWFHPLLGVWLRREREFKLQSGKPGIGRTWFDKFGETDVLPWDSVTVRGGGQFQPPRFYDRILREWSEEDYQALKERRYAKSIERPGYAMAERMPRRLAVRAEVQSAKHKLSKRDL